MEQEEKWYGSPRRLQVIAFGIITLYIGGVLTVWVSAPTLPFEEYPTQCPEDSRNCSRIAPNPYRANGQEALIVNASKSEVMQVITEWVESEPRTQIVTTSEEVGYVHSVFRSFAWRFPDDMLFHVECLNNSTVIWVHSESRVGAYDFMVNDERVLAFSDHIEAQSWSNQTCES